MSIKDHLRKRLTKILQKVLEKEKNAAGVVLVVDTQTAQMVSSALRMHHITDLGILAVENLEYKRERLDLPALYFLAPIESSFQKLYEDFETSPQYSHVHLYFTSKMPTSIISCLTQAPTPLIQRLQALVEIDLSFKLQNYAKQLASVCLALGQNNPYIRYADTKNAFAGALGEFLDDELKRNVCSNNLSFQSNDNRATLLIVDRSIDPIGPLVQEFTYQAIVHRFFHVQGELCFLQSDNGNEEIIVLSEDDPLWVQVRHAPFETAIEVITREFRNFKAQSSVAKVQSSSSPALHDLQLAIRHIHEYKKVSNMYTTHINLATACLERMEKEKPVYRLTKDLIQLLTTDMKRAKKMLVENIPSNPNLNDIQKTSLIMYGAYKMKQDDFKEIVSNAPIKQAVRNIRKLRGKESCVAIPTIIQQLATDKLSEENYPYLFYPNDSTNNSMHVSKGKSLRSRKNNVVLSTKNTCLIVYVIGGMTLDEMRTVYEVCDTSDGVDMYIGSSELFVPNSYIKQLSEIADS